jgi:hypothetical protein
MVVIKTPALRPQGMGLAIRWRAGCMRLPEVPPGRGNGLAGSVSSGMSHILLV